MTLFLRIVRIIAIPFIWIVYPFKKIGVKNIPKQDGLIVCCNHISVLDPVFLEATTSRQLYLMAKAELFKNRAFAWLIRRFGTFPVQRGKGDREAMDTARAIVSDGRVLGIFVEGTRTRNPDASPGRAKSGAALIAQETGADVLPVAVIYKKGRPRPFRRVTVRYGQVIKNEELRVNLNDRGDLRRATTRIMDEITALWKEGV